MRPFAILAVLMSLALGGCFVSNEPKFDLANASPALGEGGRYRQFELRSDGEREDEPLLVRRRTDGGYDFSAVKGDGKTVAISFHAVGSDLFVGQSYADKEWGYVFLRVAGDQAFLHLPACDKQDKAKLAPFGVVFRGQYECVIDKVSDPKGLFAQVVPGEPVTRLVKQ
jgi:hypothetical protein